MTKYVEKASDVNVEGIEFYVPEEEDGFVYLDAECTKKVSAVELKHAFEMNDIIIVEKGSSYRPIGLKDDGEVVITYVVADEEDDLSLSAKQVKSFDPELTCDVDISSVTDLLGKTIDELQSDIEFDGFNIKGTLHYVTDYTGFWPSRPDRQEGNYLALHFESNLEDPIVVELIGGESGPSTLDEDGIIILRIANNEQKVKVTCGDLIAEYSLTELILESE